MAGLEPGYQLGHYRITRSLGSGGMADVYEAQDDHLDRTVALKVLPIEYCRNPQLVQRFQKEVRAAAKLNHRNIVTVFEVGQQDSWHFFSMRLLTGGDLRRRIDEGMAPVEALAILREVADAFAHAHARGFVHRDVKPENIMFDEQGFPVLTDFGIAKALDANTHMTRTGMTMGTPRYLSPEQASGKPVDARADLYSLGIILHEMLTGRPPYDAEEAMAVIFKHVTEPVPILPPDFVPYQPLLEKLMAKDVAKRIGSAAELIKEIDALVPKTPTGELKQSQLRTTENPLIAKLMTPSPLRTPAPQTPRPVTPPPMTPAPLTPVPQAPVTQAPAPPTPVVREMTGEVTVQAPPAVARQVPVRPPAPAPAARAPAAPTRPAAAARPPAAASPAARRVGPVAIAGGVAALALAAFTSYLALRTPQQAAEPPAPAAVPAPAQPDAAAEAARAEAARREQARQEQQRQQAAQKEAAELRARQQAEADTKQRAEQEAAQNKAASDLQARQQAETEARKRAAAQEQAEARQRAEADAAARRRAEQQAEEEARRKAAADAARQEEEAAAAAAPAARAAVPVRVTIVNDCRRAIDLESVGVDGQSRAAGTLKPGVEKGFDSTESAKWRMFERSRRRPLLKEVTLTGAGQRLRVCDTVEATPADLEEEAAKERARRPTGF